MNYFVTGIDTDSGKTLAAAILCQALNADYWKPVQAGMPMDSETVQKLLLNTSSAVYKETHFLKTPVSPHAAAKKENIEIKLSDFTLPDSPNTLIIEGAGGCLVPLNDKDFVIDLASKFDTDVILVADLYLGSINHTLLTVNELKRRKLRLKGIIFNGESNAESEAIILKHSGLRALLYIDREEEIDPEVVQKYSKLLLLNWNG